jgi:NADPH:quinone reductase
VLAFAGGKPLLRCLDALTLGGRLAYPNGVEPVPRKRRRVKTTAYDGTPGVRQFERLNRAIEEAKLKVPIAKTYSLARAGAAYDFVEEGHVVGKVVIRIR